MRAPCGPWSPKAADREAQSKESATVPLPLLRCFSDLGRFCSLSGLQTW